MAIELATQFQAYTDEQFYSESKTSLVTNKDFSFDGAKTIKLYKVKTTDMEDFNRNGPILDGNKSQYGTISTLQATTETFTINKDRSFTFEVLAVIDIAQDTPGDGAGDAGNAAALHRSTHLLITLTGFQIHGQVAQRVTAPQHAGLVAKGKALSGAGGKNSVKHPAAPPFPAHTVLRASGPPPSAPCCRCTGSLRYWAAECAGAAELSSRSPTGCWKPR